MVPIEAVSGDPPPTSPFFLVQIGPEDVPGGLSVGQGCGQH